MLLVDNPSLTYLCVSVCMYIYIYNTTFILQILTMEREKKTQKIIIIMVVVSNGNNSLPSIRSYLNNRKRPADRLRSQKKT